jgi:membrane protein YdbS with pleckstrin-like domain
MGDDVDSISKFERKHYKNSRKMYLPYYTMAAILIGLLFFFRQEGLPLNDSVISGIVVFTGLVILVTEIHRIGHSYYVTENFVVHRQGYLAKEIKRVSIESISDLDAVQGPWQRLLRFGDVQIHMFSTSSVILIRNINNPEDFINLIESELNKKGIRVGGKM